MHQIEIDDEVFSYLQSQAVAFVDTPNLTLRRLFELDGVEKPTVERKKTVPSNPRKKQPKASLPTLVSYGLLKQGQEVFLVDYQENKLEQYRAVIEGGFLKWKGQSYSMSDLARELLQKEGYSSTSVRGPAHWCTEEGVTVKTLWQRYLANA